MMLFHHELHLLLGKSTISEHANTGYDMSPVSRNLNALKLIKQHLPHLLDSVSHRLDIFQELIFEFWIVSYDLDNVGAVNRAVRPCLSHNFAKRALDVFCELLVSKVDNMTCPNAFSVQAEAF